ncbi:alanine racemase [Aestuariibacter salexigens]|uniref:alanine racemase n=1 Tax=Aestuariibacter salexigens TaxID=226010 RepID=UPI0003FCCD11|nr:alanine racemase [Aestuariibacter salexigens]
MTRPTHLTIDTQALKNNLRVARALAPASAVVAVVKADAYGHGAQALVPILDADVDMFAVSCCEEALGVRRSGITKPVVLLEGCFEPTEWQLAIDNQFEPVIHNHNQLDTLRQAEHCSALNVWLKIDTGMHRLGFDMDEAVEVYQQLDALPHIGNIILMTHFASADDADPSFTHMQLARFEQIVQDLLERGQEPALSMANSACLLNWPATHKQFNRPGLMLYGLSPFEFSHPEARQLTPIMTLSSQVIAIREIAAGEAVGYGNTWRAQRPSVIATIAVGYGDGYPRSARSGTPVLINGQRASLVGRVSMDMITVDVTDIGRVNIGDPCILWGADLSANEVASWAGTIGYELITRLPPRVPRTLV